MQIGSQFLGTIDFESGSYDWGTDYKKPELHSKDLIIYELPLRTFTADESSGVPEGERGTFTGLIKKVYFQSKPLMYWKIVCYAEV